MKLMLALDIHDHPEDVLAEGRRWAERLGGTLDVAFVDEYRYNLYLVQDPAVRTVLDDQWARIRDDNEGRLQRLVESLPEAVRGQPLYLSGRAAEQIAQAAEQHDAVLLATHGRTGLSHFFLGSVAERVVRTAPCPVVVLRLESTEG